jgi:hypothetical protein
MIKHRIPAMSTIGQTFGRLTVERLAPFVKYKNSTRARVECRCSCGNYCTVSLENLKNGRTKSCGCINKERLKARKGQPRYVYTYNEGDKEQQVTLRRYTTTTADGWGNDHWYHYTVDQGQKPFRFPTEIRIPIARARALFPAAFGLPTPTKPVESVS